MLMALVYFFIIVVVLVVTAWGVHVVLSKLELPGDVRQVINVIVALLFLIVMLLALINLVFPHSVRVTIP